MDRLDIKGKLKTFISDSKQKLLSPSDEVSSQPSSLILPPGCLADRTLWSDSDREVSQLASDPIKEGEVLASLNEKYFNEDWDPSSYCLEQLGDKVGELDTIDQSRKELMGQLTTVSRRVFSLILERQSDCSSQLEHIVEVQEQLGEGLMTCTQGREGLGRAQRQFVNCSLGILARVRRRQQAGVLLDHLATIRTLSRTQTRLEELTREEEWPAAISLLLECIKVSSAYKHFTAIAQLSTKLVDTMVMTEELLDTALAKQCTNFQPASYAKLQDAYLLLGKTQTATDQLLMHFTTATHNTSWQVVYGHVCLMQDLPRPPPYPDLCREVQQESFLPCLTDLVRALWGIMLSYHNLVQWHRVRWEEEEDTEYTRNKLEAGLGRIWQDVQSKVKQFVLGSDLSQFSIESFLHFLDLLHRLIMVGQELTSSNTLGGHEQSTTSSALLQDSLVQQCLNYFSSYHTSRLEELATHLDNEGWTLCPVKHTFSYPLLAEFSHLNTLKSPSKSMNGSTSLFQQFSSSGTPFDFLCQESLEEDILLEGGEYSLYQDSDSEDDLSEEQKQELVEENRDTGRTGLTPLARLPSVSTTTTSPLSGLTVSNTAIMVLRLVGRYSHMMKVLTPIAEEVWRGICQLFEFYLYTVNMFFSRDLLDTEQNVYSARLRDTLTNIYSTVVLHEVRDGEQGVRLIGCVREATLSPGVQLEGGDSLHGLPARVVGVESAVFLATQLNTLRPHLASLLDNTQAVDMFYTNTVSAAVDLRTPIYLAAVYHSLNIDPLLMQMSKVSWDLRDVVSQHSPYVDQLLHQLQVFSSRMVKLGLVVPIPTHLQQVLWEEATRVASNMFVDGFSSARKCTNEGRALMQLDYRQFVIKLEKLSGLKPVPYQQFVSSYIKAYYIPESELGQWVEEHQEYSALQLRALVAATAYNNNKTKQKLNSLINDLSDRIRR